MSVNFGYQTFAAISGNLGGKLPVVGNFLSSHEKEFQITTSLNENCKEIEFQTNWIHSLDLKRTYLALKLKFIEGRCYETYKTKEVEKEHKVDRETDEETQEEQEAPVLFVKFVYNILPSLFSSHQVYTSNQKFYNSSG